jgi:hypothetical protein
MTKETKPKAKKVVNEYVNKQEFWQALFDYRKACDDALAAGKDKPIVPNYIGDCFIKIAQHTSYRPNFIGYTYREEMVSDGIEVCLRGIHNFNPEKSDNPFGYFTLAVWRAFLQRIAKEKKELAKKYRYIQSLDVHDLVTQEHDAGEFSNQFVEYLKSELDINVDFEREINKQRKELKESDDMIVKAVLTLEFGEEDNENIEGTEAEPK